jgi:hypothetical protein
MVHGPLLKFRLPEETISKGLQSLGACGVVNLKESVQVHKAVIQGRVCAFPESVNDEEERLPVPRRAVFNRLVSEMCNQDSTPPRDRSSQKK